MVSHASLHFLYFFVFAGDSETYHTSTAVVRFSPDAAAVGFDDAARDCQAHAEAVFARLALGGAEFTIRLPLDKNAPQVALR